MARRHFTGLTAKKTMSVGKLKACGLWSGLGQSGLAALVVNPRHSRREIGTSYILIPMIEQ